MNTRQLLRIILGCVAGIAFVAGLLLGWMFYVFYLKWVPLFENGRYFDPASGVVYHDSGFVFGLMALGSWAVSAAAFFAAKKLR